jgi:dTDP-4-amino-4,6-dideoxygalactose transaminase
MNTKQNCEMVLTEMYQMPHINFGNRASELLIMYLQSLKKPGAGVILPSITCHAVAQSVISAGYKPIFVDVNSSDFNMNETKAIQALKNSKIPIAACLVIHSFGHYFNAENVINSCLQHDVSVIEDVCQYPGKGSQKGVSAVLTSFGYSKPIFANGGGALLTTIPLNLESQRQDHSIPNSLQRTEDNFIREFYRIRNLEERGMLERGEIGELSNSYSSLFLSGGKQPDFDLLAGSLRNLDQEIEIRLSNSDRFKKLIENVTDLICPQISQKSIPWRFTFLAATPGSRDNIIKTLRSEQLHVSSWYQSLALDFKGYQESPPIISENIEKRIVNLWVKEDNFSDYFSQIQTIFTQRIGFI